ncbi:tripartite tricarboxylate transporter TctB family protein [Citricoccus zhacaiensis]
MSSQDIAVSIGLRPSASEEAAPAAVAPDTRGRLEELAIPGLLFAIAGYLIFGLSTMSIPETAKWPGPDFFPLIITVILLVVALAMTIQVVRAHLLVRRAGGCPQEAGPSTDWKATAIVVATLLVFAFTLVPLGWILAGTLLFWGVARGLGSRRPLFDLLVALGMSSLVQLAFSAGLGLSLPPGILGWF